MDDAIRLLEDRVGRAAARLDELRRERNGLLERVGTCRQRVAMLEQENEELKDRVSSASGSGSDEETIQALKTAIEELREDD